MFVHKVKRKWQKCNYVPYGVQGSVFFAGKGENTVSIDLEEAQQDRSTTVIISQDYSGTLTVGDGPLTAALIDIPAAKTQLVETGELSDKDEPIKVVEKIPVDVENCSLTLFPLEYPVEKAADSNM